MMLGVVEEDYHRALDIRNLRQKAINERGKTKLQADM
jgi:hypothetical protein